MPTSISVWPMRSPILIATASLAASATWSPIHRRRATTRRSWTRTSPAVPPRVRGGSPAAPITHSTPAPAS
ncbi:hypothetical protein G6F23_016018 [Rhizopus arrhizus]|nr:hypothetical protein G6F23_016018 [Rhizopus arrhizus]